MLIERLLFTLLIIAAAMALYSGLRWRHRQRIALTLPPTAVSAARLLYFRSETCASCQTQARYLNQLAAHVGERLRIEKIDADQDQATAAQYAIFTLPTTLIIDRSGQVRHINYGLTPPAKLTRQLEDVL